MDRTEALNALIDVVDHLNKSRSDFESVGDFHARFGLPVTIANLSVPAPITEEAYNFRLKFLLEELTELFAGYGLMLEAKVTKTAGQDDQDLPQIADALVDLVYVALGTAHMHKLPWPELFAEVQRANMSKKRAESDGESKRGSSLDVVKPEGWKAPDITGVLRDNGWNEELKGM
jgi:predicted HAD superfamily Cof-like phosphohydrolase